MRCETSLKTQHAVIYSWTFPGIHVEYDLSRPVNQRVVSLAMLCTECRVPKYEPLDPEKTYTVVLPSYIAGGGDNFTMIKEELLKHNTGGQQRRVIRNIWNELFFSVNMVGFV